MLDPRLRWHASKNSRALYICIIVLSIGLLLIAAGSSGAADKYQEMINCDLHAGPCTQSLPENTVVLEVTPRPVKAMQDLSFKVILKGKPPQVPFAPFIDLGMPGMNMGPNRVQLKSSGNDSYTGRGVIVRCPSGRRTWQATVTLPDIGQVDFIFDVIY